MLELALDARVAKLEKRKFAATSKPRRALQRKASSKRTIPAHVRREVWERDQGQCTFKNSSGQRCEARKFLEFDHIDPVARGGRATSGNLRLRCRAHNQREAECAFGAGFMHDRRGDSRHVNTDAADPDVMAALRTLGYRAEESRQAAAFSTNQTHASLEQRVRLALSWFRPRGHSRHRSAPSGPR